MRVLISGAGIAGNTLAWSLAKTGARVVIVEKSQSILPHGQSVDVKDDALTVIKKMGLMDQVLRFNTTEQGTQFIGDKGQPLARFPLRKGYASSPTSEFEILRGDLAMILHEAASRLSGVEYMFGTTIQDVISNDDDTVKVSLSNGEVHEFDLLVAADGQWSKIRKQCFPAKDVNAVDVGMYAAYYTVPRLPSDNDWWNVYLGLGSRLISTRPDPHGNIRAMFTRVPRCKVQENMWLEASRSGRGEQGELLRKEFADAGWQASRLLDAMDQAPDFYFHRIQQIKMSNWSNSRVVCVGDAAYCPSPLTGEGTPLAITGAYVLAAELSKLDEGEHPAKALEAYESTFRPFVDEGQKIPSILPAMMHPESSWARYFYHTILWALSRVLVVPGLAIKSSDIDGHDSKFPWSKWDL
ncbi:hypothetical protein JX266_005691 [Neoarthrinium moseri]|nr:hypothetical protein JX266_005691 [Neoarthrinium moseri]